MKKNCFFQKFQRSWFLYSGYRSFHFWSKRTVFNDALHLQISVQRIQQPGLLEDAVDFIPKLGAYIPTILTSQMMVAPIAMETTNNHIMYILCKKFNKIEQCILIVLILAVSIKNIMVNGRDGNAIRIIPI